MTDATLTAAEGACIEYTFDARGFVLRPGLLTPVEVQDAHAELDAQRLVSEPWHDGQRRMTGLDRAGGVVEALASRLSEHPITPLVVGYPHRLLESYAIERHHGGLDLHGGSTEFLRGSDARDVSARSWVEGGRIYSLRVKVLIYLDDVIAAEDGPLAYVEGSHKAGFSFHRAFPEGRLQAHDLVRTIAVRAGDGVWLNESLLHGAFAKSSTTRRRLLAYTFGPSFMSDWKELGSVTSNDAGYHASETERPRSGGRPRD